MPLALTIRLLIFLALLALSLLNSGQVLLEINYTYIILIHKVKSPERVTKFDLFPFVTSFISLYLRH